MGLHKLFTTSGPMFSTSAHLRCSRMMLVTYPWLIFCCWRAASCVYHVSFSPSSHGPLCSMDGYFDMSCHLGSSNHSTRSIFLTSPSFSPFFSFLSTVYIKSIPTSLNPLLPNFQESLRYCSCSQTLKEDAACVTPQAFMTPNWFCVTVHL